MKQLTTRKVPDALHAALKKYALANRHSLNDEVVIALEERVAFLKVQAQHPERLGKVDARTKREPAPKRAKGER